MSQANNERRADATLLFSSELFLVLMTLTAVASFSRVFNDTSWVAPLVAATLVAHTVMIVIRRFGRGLFFSGIVSLVVMTLQVSWTHYRPTLNAGLPSGATRDAVETDLRAAWTLFSEVKAPTEPVVGFVVMATIAIWVVAYLSDWAAFRLWSGLESVLPSFAMFVFIAFFGEEENWLPLASLYLGAVIGFQLFHRLIRQTHEVRWLAGTQMLGTSALMRAGVVLSVMVVGGALIIGPALPGAEQEALVDLDPSGGGPDTRVVISPIVDIRGRLVQQADVEAFTVRASTASYWRLASLDSFDGQIWGADNKYGKASGSLPDDFDVNAEVELITQEFDIRALGAVWLPAAYEPRAISNKSDDRISYEPVSGTLIVGSELSNSNGLTYTIESEAPTFDPDTLSSAPALYPPEIRERYFDLPSDFSPTATALALEITAPGDNHYQKALLLQNYFRENFEYDLEVGEGHSSNRIDEFLAAGVGYCEQFAGSFAAMARAVGIPSRVAVGFTWGQEDPNDQNLFHVRGEHAHAWPEVYIPESGWVAFEPTPGRGAPNAQRWTGQEPEQASPGNPAETEQPAPTPEVRDELPPVETPPTDPGGATTTQGEGTSEGDGIPTWIAVLALVLLIGGGALVLYSLVVIGLKRSRTKRRFDGARDNRERVNAVWIETIESLRPLGVSADPAETVQEFSTRAGQQTEQTKDDLTGLGVLTVEANYGPDEPSADDVESAEQHRDNVATTVASLAKPGDRLKDALDPRPLVRR